MNRLVLTGVTLVLGAGLLAGCGRGAGSGGGGTSLGMGAGNFCTPFRTSDANAPLTTVDPGAVFDDCLHRWGYSLAGAKDNADLVASAAVSACGVALTHWNQQSLSQQNGPTENAPSLTTGQSGDMVTARAQYAQSRALFYVVQARAGNCAPPTVKPPAGEP